MKAATLRQRIIVWLWIAVIVAMGIYPPWTLRSGYPAGYHAIFAPPSRQIRIDQSRLTVQWVVATVLAAGLYFTWPRTK